MNDLIGKTFLGFYMDEEKVNFAIETKEGIFRYYVDADCCSEGWIEHVNFPWFQAEYKTINEIVTIELGEVMPSRQEFDMLYGIKIKFDGGELSIEYRNSSNGYYGSSISTSKINTLDGLKLIKESF